MFASLRHLAQLVTIARTLARHDALFPLEALAGMPSIGWLARRWSRQRLADPPGRKLAAALEELGPSFIKLGQTLSTRPDLVGEDVALELAALQDRLPPFPTATAVATIEGELGRPLSAVYAGFDPVPVAAASIAQVHFAITAEGEPVAVKVLRPGIEAAFARDIDLFLWLARLAERLDRSMRRLRPVEIVRTLAATVRTEMDLRLEAAAASELADNFAGDLWFRVPRVDWTRTGQRVLTLERVAGIPIDERDALVAAGHDIRTILSQAANAFFAQVFRDGFFHADMHAGNVFVAPDGGLVAVDFGIMGRLDRRTRDYLADMLIGFVTRDYRLVAEVHFRAGYVPPHQSLPAFAQAARSIGEPILERPLNEISIGRLLAQLFQITKQFEMPTQPQLLLLQKTLLMAEGMGRRLDPTINMWTLARPLVEDWLRENRGPEARVRRLVEDAVVAAERVPQLIETLERAATRVADGAVLIHLRDRGLWARLWPVWFTVAATATLLLVLQ